MTKRQVTKDGLKQTAGLLLIVYLDIAVLGGVAALAHWSGYLDQPQSRSQLQACSAAYEATLDKSVKSAAAFEAEDEALHCVPQSARSGRGGSSAD
jgi:hypothetical protein